MGSTQSSMLFISVEWFNGNYQQAIAKCLKKVIELQVPLLHQNVTEY
jgi:hypothetical protein